MKPGLARQAGRQNPGESCFKKTFCRLIFYTTLLKHSTITATYVNGFQP